MSKRKAESNPSAAVLEQAGSEETPRHVALRVDRRVNERVERRLSQRQKILDIARDMYALDGYNAVSMRAVAQRLGFSKQAIYYYFPSKEAIFLALVEEGLALLEAQRPGEELPDPLENVKLPYWRYYEFSKAHPEYFALMWVDPAAPPIDWQVPQARRLVRMSDDALERVKRCMREGVFPATLDVNKASSLLLAAVHGCAVIGLNKRPPMNVSIDETAASLLDAAVTSLTVR
jgi:AcrR family transcriptional regulator